MLNTPGRQKNRWASDIAEEIIRPVAWTEETKEYLKQLRNFKALPARKKIEAIKKHFDDRMADPSGRHVSEGLTSVTPQQLKQHR